MGNVQISKELFMQLCRYHCLDDKSDDLSESISAELESKLNKLVNRELYSKMKDKDATPEERKKAMQHYLRNKNI